MRVKKAVLKKRKTEDGMIEFWEGVPLGKVYHVDMETKEEKMGIHLPTNRVWWRDMVWDVEGGGWLAVECLEIEGGDEEVGGKPKPPREFE
jgi:hypothetical protein